jgi:uncharacterized membrane protein
MKNMIDFLKTTAAGGFFILLPLLLLEMMLEELFEGMIGLARPLADLFPGALGEHDQTPVITAILLILLVSFILGLIGRSESGRNLGRWIERNTLERLPPYTVLKGLTARIVDFGEGTRFKPALYNAGNGELTIRYMIEDHGDGWTTILEPWAPTPMAGSIKIVPTERVELLYASFGKATEVLSHWGVGARELRGVGEPT